MSPRYTSDRRRPEAGQPLPRVLETAAPTADARAREERVLAALPGTVNEIAARTGLSLLLVLAAVGVMNGSRVTLSGGVYSRATPEQTLLAGLDGGTAELRARVLAKLPGNAVQVAARLNITDWLALSVLAGLGRDGAAHCVAGSWRAVPTSPAAALTGAAAAGGR